MIEQLLSSTDFNVLMHKHSEDLVGILLKKGINFSLLTNIVDVTFEPPLPPSISQGFKPITMFFLAGYTFESTQLQAGVVSFEAGFGSDNFGSLVSVPLHAILQIVIEEVPIFINLGNPAKEKVKKPKEQGVQRSMNALLSNPNNQKLFKK